MLQNCEAAATLHWACQLAGIVITPVNWRAKADELDFCIENSESCALVYQDISANTRSLKRRLLSLVTIYDGGSRADAARLGGVGVQTIRDWVLRFNFRGA